MNGIRILCLRNIERIVIYMRSWIISIGMLLVTSSVLGQVRKVVDIKDWNFSHDNKTWEKVTVPHDWAISGPFDKKWDLQVVAI